jgi:hypothetical protein
MTHTSHRRGDRKSLEGDYIVLMRMEDYTPEVKEKTRALVKICGKHNTVAMRVTDKDGRRLRYVQGWEKKQDSGIWFSSTLEELLEAAEEPVRFSHALYTKKEDVKNVIKELKEAELGLSVVISGIFDEVFDICKEAGTGPHTVNLSAETLGNIELLPEPKILELLTMCGHDYIAKDLTTYLIERVRYGKITAEEAAIELGKQCMCNVFNPIRGADLITKMAFNND